MKKQILAMSILAALSGCDLDNKDALKVPATFDNTFTTEVGFSGTEGFGFDIELTTGHGSASGTLVVNDVNYGEAEPNYEIPVDGKYGTFTLTYLQSGYATWTYDLREEVEAEGQEEAVQQVKDIIAARDASLFLEDPITITTLDGTKQVFNIVIRGVDKDEPTEVKGALVANASVRETSAYGSVAVYDPHFGESKFQVGPVDDEGKPTGILSDKGYGSLFIDEDGRWEFKVNRNASTNNPEKPEELLKDLLPEADSEPQTDTVTVTTADGTTVTMDVNIYGAVPNFAAKVLSTTADDSRFDVNMLNLGQDRNKTKEGKMVFKIKVSEDLVEEAAFSVACSDNFHNSDNRRVATFYVQPDTGELSMWSGEMVPGGDYFNDAITGKHFALNSNGTQITKRAVFDQSLVPGEWSEFILEWKDASDTTKPKLKAWLDGEQLTSDHGAIPTDTNDYFTSQTLGGKTVVRCVNQMRFEVKPDEEVGGTGAFFVDDIQYYTDRTADPIFDADSKALLNEKFDTNQVGDVVMDIVVDGKTPYVNASSSKLTTTDNVLVEKDL